MSSEEKLYGCSCVGCTWQGDTLEEYEKHDKEYPSHVEGILGDYTSKEKNEIKCSSCGKKIQKEEVNYINKKFKQYGLKFCDECVTTGKAVDFGCSFLRKVKRNE